MLRQCSKLCHGRQVVGQPASQTNTHDIHPKTYYDIHPNAGDTKQSMHNRDLAIVEITHCLYRGEVVTTASSTSTSSFCSIFCSASVTSWFLLANRLMLFSIVTWQNIKNKLEVESTHHTLQGESTGQQEHIKLTGNLLRGYHFRLSKTKAWV